MDSDILLLPCPPTCIIVCFHYTTLGILNSIALTTILVDGIVPVAGHGSLVALLVAAYLEEPVISRRAFGVLADCIGIAVLGDHIILGSAEYYLVGVAAGAWRIV